MILKIDHYTAYLLSQETRRAAFRFDHSFFSHNPADGGVERAAVKTTVRSRSAAWGLPGCHYYHLKSRMAEEALKNTIAGRHRVLRPSANARCEISAKNNDYDMKGPKNNCVYEYAVWTISRDTVISVPQQCVLHPRAQTALLFALLAFYDLTSSGTPRVGLALSCSRWGP